MKCSISKRYEFEAAHRLPNVDPSHKCYNLHGHNFRVSVFLRGDLTEQGWVMDFFDLDKIVTPLIQLLDHSYLNEIEGLENPTSENLAIWFWKKLKPVCPCLSEVAVSENEYSAAAYSGE